VTTGVFLQTGLPATLLPVVNRAPATGPVVGSTDAQLITSGLNSGVRATSATMA